MPEQPAVVFLTNRLPDPLIEALSLAGWQVFEALAISEVLHLCEHQNIRAVVIAAGYSHPALQEIREHHTTLQLSDGVSPADVLWELSNLFQKATLQ